MDELEKAARKQEIKVCPYEYRCSVSDECYLCQWGGASKQIRGAANESFVLGAQWQSKQSPWISVEERTPETDDDLYFVLDTTITPPGVDVCEFDVKSKEWTNSRHVVVQPTHWMPIPE